jgi:hypothetical protein
MTRTAEQEQALLMLQQALPIELLVEVDACALMIRESCEQAEFEGAANKIGYLIMVMLRHIAPEDMPESLQYSLPYAFSELVKARLRKPS